MKNKNHTTQDDNLDPDELEENGVKDIVPEDEEYYTLNLKRNIDTFDDDDDSGNGFDVANVDPHNLDILDEPTKSSSFYADATLVKSNPDYRPRSSNQGGVVDEDDILDQGATASDVEPGHWGIDEDTG